MIHAVGPRWNGGRAGEAQLLASAYEQSLRLAARHGCRSVAFPAISCGVYGYPVARAAAVALATLRDELACDDSVDITVCCFSTGTGEVFRRAWEEARHGGDPFNAA